MLFQYNICLYVCAHNIYGNKASMMNIIGLDKPDGVFDIWVFEYLTKHLTNRFARFMTGCTLHYSTNKTQKMRMWIMRIILIRNIFLFMWKSFLNIYIFSFVFVYFKRWIDTWFIAMSLLLLFFFIIYFYREFHQFNCFHITSSNQIHKHTHTCV